MNYKYRTTFTFRGKRYQIYANTLEELYEKKALKKKQLQDDLIVYDKPKELSEFMKHDQCTYFHKNDKSCSFPYRCKNKWLCDSEFLTRPPQSWCYVVEL